MSPSSSPLQAAPATGRRRFWLTVAAFAVANVCIWVGYHHYTESRTSGLLRVERFSHANGGAVAPRPRLTWLFNFDVAPSPDGQAPGTIAPAIPGKWEWPTPRTLAFTPDVDLPKATRITVTLPGGSERLRTAEGFRLREPYVSTFQTAPLALTQVRQSGFDGDHVVLELHFDDTVVAADVMRHLSLTGPDEKPLTFEPHGLADGPIVRVRTATLPPTPVHDGRSQRVIRVTLSPGLAGRSGPLAMAEAVAMPVSVDAELIATDADPLTQRRGESGIRVEFNNDVNAELLKPLLSIEPAVPFTVADAYNGVILTGDFAPGTRYAVKIAAPPAGADKSRYPRAGTLSVFMPDREPDVWFEHEAGYLGSRGNRTLLAHAVNVFDLSVRVTRLYDSNLVEWRNATSRDGWRVSSADYAAPLAKRSIRLPGKKNEKQEVRIALDEILPTGAARDGAYLVELITSNDDEPDDRRPGRFSDQAYASSVVTLSDIGLSAKRGRDDATVWVTSLSTAAPMHGIRVRLFSNKNQPLGEAVSGPDGLARVALAPAADGENPAVVIADRAAASSGSPDINWLDIRTSTVSYAEAETSGRPYLRAGHEAFAYTDRGVYRPGETVHLRAIVRGPDNTMPTASFPVLFQIVRPDLRNWRAQTTPLDADGAAGWELALPADLPTGKWTANVGLPGDGATKNAKWLGTVTFQVEEFIPDRMKVEMSLGADGAKDGARHVLGDAPLRASIQAEYLFGRPVANRPATLTARLDPAEFRPAGWTGWTFGDASDTAGPLGIAQPLGRRSDLPITDLNATGNAAWDVNVRELIAKGESVDEKQKSSATADGNAAYPGPWKLTATASVAEEGGRAVSATKKLDIDLAPYYVGVRRPSSQLVRPKTPCAFEIATVSPATSKAVSVDAELTATLYRETWNNSLVHEKGQYRYESTRVLEAVDDADAATITLADGRGTCTVVAPTGGAYVLRVSDVKSGVVTSVSFYAGSGAWDDQISREDPERLELILLPPAGIDTFSEALRQRDFIKLVNLARDALSPAPETGDGRAFAVGERPRVLVRSPFKGRLLLNVETDAIVSSQVVDMPASQAVVPIEVTSACRPNAYVTATVLRSIDPDAKWRAHRATGATRLRVDNADRKLNVQIAAPSEIRPATSLTTEVRVTDSLGRAVPGAAVTVAAVDEGVCRLTSFKTPDPFAFFTATRALAVTLCDLYGQLLPEVPKPDATSTPGGDGDGDQADDSRYRSPVAAKRVRPVAIFSGAVHTGPDGVARVDFPVPQFTGELRLMAVAYAGNDVARPGFGSAQHPVAVRSPLIVQSSWPRFAAPGDRFTVPLVVFNNSTSAGDVKLSLEIDDPLKFADGDAVRAARSVRVDAGGQTVDAVDVVALDQIGVARIRLVATLDGETFEESLELPVRPASPAMTRGGFAAATPGKPAALDVPPGMLDGTAKLQVNVTPWPLLELPQGLDYLDRYPYGCAEQTISTLLPLVYLGDIGDRIAPHLFDRERVKAKVQAGVIRLLGMRTADGGVAMWPGERTTWPWASVYAAHFAVEARVAGHEIPDDLYDGLIAYARGLLSAARTDDANQLESQAYACYVLALAGKPERAAMSRLGEMLSGPSQTSDGGASPQPAQARLHIAAAWVAAGRKDLAEALIPKVLPSPRTTRQRTGNVGSPTRDRAVMLTALLAAQPDRADLPALAQQLADDGRHGRWQSTQDTAFAVMALGRYVKQGTTAEPYTSAELWQGGKQVAAAKAGQSIVWTHDAVKATEPFEIRVAGPAGARAHVAWLQVGVPTTPPADAASGIKLRRRYLDDGGAPIRDNAVRSGDLVKVELTIESESPLENVVIEDLLPTGLEIENPRLATQAGAAGQPPAPTREDAPTFEPRRLDMRDDRLILVGDLARAGAATYVYTARAVSRGTFVVPPVRAECMYDAGTHAVAGGGGTIRVVAVGKTGIADVSGE